MPRYLYFSLLAAFFCVAGCGSAGPFVAQSHSDWEAAMPPESSTLVYRVFLLGDAGATSEDEKQLLNELKRQLAETGEDGVVVFLGDNIYCCGLPDSLADKRAAAEYQLDVQIEAVKDFPGRVVFVPGNHDWNQSRKGGLETLARQEKYIEEKLGRGNTFLPDNGFPGPADVKLTDQIRLIALDTEWWLTQHERSLGDAGDFDIEEDVDFLVQLQELIEKNDDKDLLIVTHHPLFTNGLHGGRFPLKTHLFPLTVLEDYLYVPLPILGSLLPIFIRNFGTRQDLAHPRYQSMKRGILEAMSGHESIIYASGHEHNLQLFDGPDHTYIVSGAGSKETYVARGRGATFAYKSPGFTTVQYYEDGSIWVEFWEAKYEQAKVVFRKQIKGPSRDRVNPEVPVVATSYPDYSDSTYVIAANSGYQAGPTKSFWMGSHNREVWSLPVEVPYLDLGRFAGGLTPVKRGGGMQTFSLRFQGEDGHQYSLRSIDKDPSVSIPEPFRETVAREIIQDQIASIHPYGAFAIPVLARAAGIMHAEPQLVYVPDDPRLGIYRETFANQLMMIEIRPDNDMSDFPNFGNAEDVISAQKMYEEITGDNDHRVDTEAFVRARLFDMLLSDWDRHKLQWRWGAFEPEDREGKIYRPIPKDRDWAFNKYNGFIPSAYRIGVDPKFQQFEGEFKNVKGLTLNGLQQDRRLTARAERTVWLDQARVLQESLTDEVIEEAVRQWPASVFEYHGKETIETLKARRDQLEEAAHAYYEILAQRVDLVASNKHERFIIRRIDNDKTEVTVEKINKEGEFRKVLYSRTFLTEETDEIVLYALDGNDEFVFEGSADTGILIRAVGGAGQDRFVDRSNLRLGAKRALFYDTNETSIAEAGQSTELKLDDDPAINSYQSTGYRHNAVLPIVSLSRDQEDGFFVGGGVKIYNHGFRKDPYKAYHKLEGEISVFNGAFSAEYNGHFIDVLNKADLRIFSEYNSTGNTRNFFGLGNNTRLPESDISLDFFQINYAETQLRSTFSWDFGPGMILGLGPHLNYYYFTERQTATILPLVLSSLRQEGQWFSGLHMSLDLEDKDNLINPKKGYDFSTTYNFNVGIQNTDHVFGQLHSTFAFYLSPSLSPQITFAGRLGLGHNTGDFPFYFAQFLGGRDTIRGWRSQRFAGRTVFYTNAELRLKLFQFSTYVAIGEAGLLTFLDNGRVWTEEDEIKGTTWHQGYGAGLWASMFDALVFDTSLSFSEETTNFTIKLRFFY